MVRRLRRFVRRVTGSFPAERVGGGGRASISELLDGWPDPDTGGGIGGGNGSEAISSSSTGWGIGGLPDPVWDGAQSDPIGGGAGKRPDPDDGKA